MRRRSSVRAASEDGEEATASAYTASDVELEGDEEEQDATGTRAVRF